MATTTKVFNMAGGKHSAEAYSSFEGLLYGSCVADGFVVTKSSSNMNCSIAAGAGLIKVGTTYARRVAIEGDPLTVTVSAASATLARRDTIVLYVDNSVTPTTSVEDNTNNILKGMVVAGTPAQNPAAPNATTIQSAVGAGNPYIILYDILVPANATNLSTATLYDRRVMAAKALVDTLDDGSVDADKLVDGSIDTAKLADAAITEAKMGLVGTSLTFTCASGGSTVGSLNGTLIKLGTNLAVLIFAGSTGWNDTGTGARNIVVNLSPANFTSIKGASVNSWYSGDVSAYQTYCGVSTASIDNYVQKSTGTSEARLISGVIFGTV